ncbi:FlgB family protein [Roseovarius sp. SCSIO 43702]|uniref:FlgB family protein n=1 Tax=Roseovarius sp. SCSIO 43702 TaxID=2823043 RepID=UPI001C73C720|nr:FlgB family protein [Roseovarius sp. SCSIO 43702]QYX57100.1 FlgB family protein [Roseovarius sp. SCSIO 43702]
MFADLDIFRLAHAMARHAGSRQSVIAQNIANADTPGYAARDIQPFGELMGGGIGAPARLRATRPSHLDATAAASDVRVSERRDVPTDPNGNSVALETEMMTAVQVKRDHDRAIAIYRSSLNILRSAVGRR